MGKSGASSEISFLLLFSFELWVLTSMDTILRILEAGSLDNSRGNTAGEADNSHDGHQRQGLEELHIFGEKLILILLCDFLRLSYSKSG